MDQFRFKNYDNIITKVTISYFLVHDFYSYFIDFSKLFVDNCVIESLFWTLECMDYICV